MMDCARTCEESSREEWRVRISEELDSFGREVGANGLRVLRAWISKAAQDTHSPFSIATLPALRAVIDSSSAQRLVRKRLQGEVSGVLDAVDAGLLELFAPPLLVKELLDKCEELAIRSHSDTLSVEAVIRSELLSRIRISQPSLRSRAHMRSVMRDPEDVDFTAVATDIEVDFIVTEDHDFGNLGFSTLTVSAVGKALLLLKKEVAATGVALPTSAVVVGSAVDLVKASKRALEALRPHAKPLLCIAGAMMIASALFPERSDALLRKARATARTAWRRWEPLVFECLEGFSALLEEQQSRKAVASRAVRRMRDPSRDST